MDLPVRKFRTHAFRQFHQHVSFGEFVPDLVDRVEPEPVEVEFLQPVERVLDEEAPHRVLLVGDRRTPRRVPLGVEEVPGVETEIIPVGTEMIVDDIEQHHQPVAVRGIDEGLHVLRRAVSLVRRVG